MEGAPANPRTISQEVSGPSGLFYFDRFTFRRTLPFFLAGFFRFFGLLVMYSSHFPVMRYLT